MSEQYQPEQATIDERPVEEQGVLSRIQGMAVNAWRSAIRHPRELLAIGAASFACAQAAELSTGAEPVIAGTGNVPAATAGSLEQKCAKDILKVPSTDEAKIFHAGKRNQVAFIRLGFDPVAKDCNGKYRRIASAMPRLIRGHKKINLDGPLTGNTFWDSVYYNNVTDKNNRGGEGGLSEGNSNNLNVRYWRHGDRADFRLRLQEYEVQTGDIVRTKITTHPMTIVRR